VLFFLNGVPNELILPVMMGVFFGALIGMTVHEFAHNYVAHLMGDPYPQRSGRLTLNPAVHIYGPGFLMFLIIGFGILGTAPIAAQRMKNPRWGYLAAVAAGPFSNLLVAIVFGIIFRIFFAQSVMTTGFYGNFPAVIVLYIVNFNLLLFIFNLLPVFPIDGWHMTLALLPPEQAHWWKSKAMITQYIFIGLFVASFVLPANLDILGIIIGQPVNVLGRAIMGF
jgi:Zn-dependent protease